MGRWGILRQLWLCPFLVAKNTWHVPGHVNHMFPCGLVVFVDAYTDIFKKYILALTWSARCFPPSVSPLPTTEETIGFLFHADRRKSGKLDFHWPLERANIAMDCSHLRGLKYTQSRQSSRGAILMSTKKAKMQHTVHASAHIFFSNMPKHHSGQNLATGKPARTSQTLSTCPWGPIYHPLAEKYVLVGKSSVSAPPPKYWCLWRELCGLVGNILVLFKFVVSSPFFEAFLWFSLRLSHRQSLRKWRPTSGVFLPGTSLS